MSVFAMARRDGLVLPCDASVGVSTCYEEMASVLLTFEARQGLGTIEVSFPIDVVDKLVALIRNRAESLRIEAKR
jgi:hypothetical protein